MASVRTRKRGKTWSYSFDIGTHPETGRRRMKEKGGFPTQAEAYDAGVAAYADWKHGNIGIVSEKVTLADFFQSWMESIVKANVRPSTYAMYESRFHASIEPMLGSRFMQDIHPRDIDAFVRSLSAAGKSRMTIVSILSVLSCVFKYAVYPAEIVRVNPATCISIPRSAPKKVLDRRVIPREELAALLHDFETRQSWKYFCLPVLIGYYTGLRIGEVVALCWEDISFQHKTLSVVRQLCISAASKHTYFSAPKTATSRRTVCLSNTLLGKLAEWRRQQDEERLSYGRAWQLAYEVGEDRRLVLLPAAEPAPEGAALRRFVCTAKYGLPISRASLMIQLRKHGMNFHSLRHTHATRLIEAGAKPVDVAARLGHANVQITENLYSHDTEKMARETAELVDKVM